MANIRSPHPVKAIVALLYKDAATRERVDSLLEEQYGPVDHVSEACPFTHSTYYCKEMGEPITRQFVSLRELISPDELVSFKEQSNAWEEQLAGDGPRIANIDPGYLTLHNLVLASAKDFSHRIHLGRGIFGDVNLIYSGSGYQALPWSYPDYVEHIPFFMNVRKNYKTQLDEWFVLHPDKKRD